MKKIIRLTESDLTRLVKRIIRESNESKPKMIEIKLLSGWEDRLKEMQGGTSKGRVPYLDGGTVKLMANNNGVKIGYGPYERENKRTFFYARYRPEISEIRVDIFNCFGYDAISRCENYDTPPPPFYLTDDYYQPKDGFDKRDKHKTNFCVSAGGFRSEFDSFDVGEIDDMEYFEIVATDGEYQSKEEEQLSERYFRRKKRY